LSATTVAFTAGGVAAEADVPIDVAIVQDRETLVRLEPEWNALVAQTGNEPFYRHEYIASWIQSFTPRQPLKLLVGRNRAGRLVALLPLVEERTSICGIPATLWASPTNVHSYRFDLIAVDPASASTAFLRRLRAEKGWDGVRLTDVAPYGRAWQLHAAARDAGLPAGVYEAQRSTYISLPSSYDELASGLSAKFRSNLRRRRKLLEKKGRVSVELVTGGPELQGKLEQCFAIEQSGWKGRSGEPANHDPRIHGFYSELARRASAEGSFSLFLLHLDDRPIAFHYGLTQDGVYSLIMTSYDESLHDCSPGHLLVEEVLKVCIANGRREFDFLGCDLEWKRAWSPTARPHSWLFLFRDSLRGRLLEAIKFRWAPALRRLLKREPIPAQES
jgi:CelD/BcsL family acetyltransferase involved in cellulose biosynthesis